MSWFSRIFGGEEEKTTTDEAKPAADGLPAPLPKEAPAPAPLTPMSVLTSSNDEAADEWDADPEDGMTIVPGEDSDIADMIAQLREEADAEKKA